SSLPVTTRFPSEVTTMAQIGPVFGPWSFRSSRHPAVHARGGASPREQEDARLRPLVRQIFWEHKRRYGARRIAAELAARGEICGPRRASRLLKQLGLRAIQPRSFHPRTTQSRHPLGYSPNLLLEAQPPSGINQVWLGDITFEFELCQQ